MIKILHYVPGFRNGGIESRLLDWYRNSDRTKIQYVLVKLNNIDDTENMKEFVELGGQYYNLPPVTASNLLRLSARIRQILISEKIDVVHVHSLSTGIFVLREAKRLGIKCRILHSRTTDYLPNEKNLAIKNALRYITPHYANHFFACSYEAGLWGCGKKHKNDIVVIKNGIQVEKFVFNKDIRNTIRQKLALQDKIVIGTIGRISPQKNIPFLLKIFSKLSKKSKKYVLLIVGDGNRDIVYDYYTNKKLPDNVIMVGNKKNVWDYYMAFDVFCSCSLYEGFGTTAIEAQATGIPTILSDKFPEVVKLTDFVCRLGIEDNNLDEWVNSVEMFAGQRYPDKGMSAVIENGYSASGVASELQKFYLSNI